MHPLRGLRSQRKPIVDGFLAPLCLGLLLTALWSCPGAASEPLAESRALTEAEAVTRGLALPAYADVVQREIALSQANAAEERLWPNPQVFYSHEDAADSVEEIVTLTQELNLSGSRGLRAQAADHLLSAAEQSVQRRSDLHAARIREDFYDVLLAQERIAAILQWTRQLDAAGSAVAKREAAGDVSAYDRRRVERELHNAESRVTTESALLEDAWTSLAPLVAIEPAADGAWPAAKGTLLPVTPPPPLEELVTTLEARPDLRALQRQVDAAELRSSAAARGWIPRVTVGAGPKIVDNDGRNDTGFTVTAFVPIPVFRREQTDRIRAESEARYARGQLALRRQRALAQLRGAWRNARRLTQAARTFADKTENASAHLVRSAEAAYRGGEIGVLELLDAYRSGLDDQLRRLDLERETRHARILLDATVGGEAKP